MAMLTRLSNRFGPHKLAKAFAFCLENAPQSLVGSESPAASLRSPSVTLLSPQSLIRESPGDTTQRVERNFQEYFPPTKPSRATEYSLDAAGDDPNKRKPVLLLVEDNIVNLQVFIACFGEFLLSQYQTNLVKLLSGFVKKNKYEYDTAENGLVALQAFQNGQKHYDIVFMGKQPNLYLVTS